MDDKILKMLVQADPFAEKDQRTIEMPSMIIIKGNKINFTCLTPMYDSCHAFSRKSRRLEEDPRERRQTGGGTHDFSF